LKGVEVLRKRHCPQHPEVGIFIAGIAAQESKHDSDIILGYLEDMLVDSVYESTEISFIEPACAGGETPYRLSARKLSTPRTSPDGGCTSG
jgi:hypothetical protein